MNDEGGIVEREIFIAAMPEVVFDFLIDPALMAQWIGLLHTLEARPGGLFQVEVSGGNVACGSNTAPPRGIHVGVGLARSDPSHVATGYIAGRNRARIEGRRDASTSATQSLTGGHIDHS